MSSTLLPGTLRKEFKYPSGYRLNPGANALALATIEQATAGLRPYKVDNALFSDAYIDEAAERLARYRLAWKFYKGEHFDTEYEDGERKVVANFCKQIADVGVDWFVAKGWKPCCRSGNEMVAEMLDDVWKWNKKMKLTETLALYGAVTGDSFVYVNIQTTDDFGKKLPVEEQKVRLSALNPAHVFPVWSPHLPGEMAACLIQYPTPNPEDLSSEILLSLIITPTTWALYYDNDLKSQKPNPFGMVNVAHIPNFILSDSCFGQSDIHHITALNEEYNLVLNTIRRIIKYHAEPTTLIFGAKVGDLEKGSRKVWSGLPETGRVENLVLQSDLSATVGYLNELKDNIAQLSFTPKSIFSGQQVSISNTSGLAMQMSFQPLIEKTDKRRIAFAEGLKRVNKLIVLAHEKLLGIPVTELSDFPESVYDSEIQFTSPLPRDEKSELDAAQMKLNMHIWSRAEAIRRLSDTPEYTRLVLETLADERHEVAKALEMQRAQTGMAPNPAFMFLNSSVLSEDFLELAKKHATADDATKDPE
jgi:hypothetical protein